MTGAGRFDCDAAHREARPRDDRPDTGAGRTGSRTPGVRAAAGTAAAVVLVALAAACGGSNGGSNGSGRVAQLGSATTQGGSTAAAPTTAGGPVAFSRCMRSNGVPTFPDPGSNGAIPKTQLDHLGVSSARFQGAQRACQHLLPNGGRPPSRARQQQMKALGLQFARCVRAHGVPSFPDPDASGRIPDPASVGVDQGSPTFRAANDACAAYRPPYMPSNAAYEQWAQTHAGGGS